MMEWQYSWASGCSLLGDGVGEREREMGSSRIRYFTNPLVLLTEIILKRATLIIFSPAEESGAISQQ